MTASVQSNCLKYLKILQLTGRERKLIRNLGMGQTVKLRLDQGITDSVEIGRGIRLECSMPPTSFNLYGKFMEEGLLIK